MLATNGTVLLSGAKLIYADSVNVQITKTK